MWQSLILKPELDGVDHKLTGLIMYAIGKGIVNLSG